MDPFVSDRSYTTNCITLWQSAVDVVPSAVWRTAGRRDRSCRLGTILYTLYTADLTYVVVRHGIRLHQYADDTDSQV